jgi:glycerophosphodiester phosphodiesterase
LLFERYGMSSKLPDAMDKDEMQDLMGTLLELRGQYRKLQWYGEVNRRGFVKITKKLDKKIETSSAQSRYLSSKVDPKPFATNNKLTQDMRAINDWLSALNEARPKDDNSSIASGASGSLHRVASRNALKVHPATIENLDTAIRGDDTLSMSELVDSALANATPAAHRKFLLDLLQRAISFRAWKCIAALLKQLPSIDQDDEINKRNCLHRLLIAIGRSRAMEDSNPSNGITDMARAPVYINAAEAPIRGPDTFQVIERDPATSLGKDDPAVKVLTYVLDHLSPEQRLATHAKDVYGRIPLHYAAQYGLVAATQQLMKHMQDWDLFDVTGGIDSVGWQDVEGYAPLHLAVIGGHYRTTKALLLAEDEYGEHEEITKARKQVEKSGASLELATHRRYHKIIELLVDAGVDVNYRDQQNETALHIAARFGYTECAEILLKAPGVNPEIAEKTFGWTPLFIACVDGHLPVVELLLAAGANPSKSDASGWTPQEHAALRGHIDIARRLALVIPAPRLHEGPEPVAKPSQPADATPLEDRRSNGVSKDGNGTQRVPGPLKEFGHRYLTDESMVLVSLGTMDTRKNLPPVSLESIALTDVHSTQLDTALSVVVSAQGATGEPSVIDLPIQENISTSPVTFSTKDPSKVKLYFDLIPTYSGSTKKVIGRGVALLSSIKQTVGSNRMLLQGDLSVPMVAADTLDLIGTINFNFLVITPFQHPNMAISEDQTYWRSTSTMVIGHRGLGKNMASKTSLQLGENTIQSFITAANLGASYVEFDVQLTKDHIPVIYHDFLVSETGADVPVHSLTLEQFLHVNEGTPRATSRTQSPAPSGDNNSNSSSGDEVKHRPQRSYSLGGADNDRRTDMRERMKHTRDFKTKGFKGNVRGEFIQSPFATLEEMFHKIPLDVGFNIEMKYPMLFETEAEGMDSYAVELNSYVDTILRLVYDMNQKRNIIFSSFNPDVCLLLSFKQPSIPVLFLTDAGASEVGDIRASSVQEAVRFASRWKLLGIVAAADPLVLCPRLIRVVKESGLVCVSYGSLNNDIHNSKLQAQEGIDAVIVDSVLKVRKGLTDAETMRAQHGNGISTLGNGAVELKVAQ